MNSSECPPFQDAVAQFREFLATQRFDPDLLWIFREDVVALACRTYIKVPVPSNDPLAESLYNCGLQIGLGIHLSVFCLLEGRPCCYVWVPRDQEEAEYRLLSGLKLSVPKEPCFAVPIGSRLRWKWLKWCESRVPDAYEPDDLPLRTELQAKSPLTTARRCKFEGLSNVPQAGHTASNEEPIGQFIEFEVNDPDRFSRLQKIFAELKKDKDAEDFRPDDAWPKVFDDQALDHFYWPSPAERQQWLTDLRHRPIVEIPTESAMGQHWNFFSMIDCYQNAECDLRRCEVVGEGKGRLEFCSLAYPYGGVGWMVALIEAFGFKVTGIQDGTGFVRID